ncbi:hypothetical protein F5H01DRAFT_143784 [Linnemannia elongata]|nr:hypothetical protein F5H01DRAFT_143784 [Linnemannia elongata]
MMLPYLSFFFILFSPFRGVYISLFLPFFFSKTFSIGPFDLNLPSLCFRPSILFFSLPSLLAFCCFQ